MRHDPVRRSCFAGDNRPADVSLARLYLLRAIYLLLIVGLGALLPTPPHRTLDAAEGLHDTGVQSPPLA